MQSQLCELIGHVIRNPNNITRAQYEERLTELLENKLPSFEALLAIAANPDASKSEREMTRVLLTKIVESDGLTDYDVLNTLFDMLTAQLLDNPHVDPATRKNFADITSYLLVAMVRHRRFFTRTQEKLSQLIDRILAVVQNESSALSYLHGLILLLTAVFKSMTVGTTVVRLFGRYSAAINYIADERLATILTELSSGAFNAERISETRTAAEFNIRFEILHSFATLIKVITKSFAIDKNAKNSEMKVDGPLHQLYGIIGLKIGNTTTTNDNFVISQTNSGELNAKLNVLKCEAVSALNLLFHRYNKSKSANMERLQVLFKSAAKTILTALYTYFTQKRHTTSGSDCASSSCSDLLRAGVKYLLATTTRTEYYDIYTESYPLLIKHVLLPSLLAEREELENLIENPAEFVNFNDQVIRYQSGNNLKCVLASLLCNICANVDGAMRFTVFGVVANINRLMSLGINSPQLEMGINLNPESDLSPASVVSEVEGGLLVLSVLSRVTENKKHILTLMEHFIEKIVPYLSVLGDVLTIRFMFFITSYIDKIYVKQQGLNRHKDILEWLLKHVHSSEAVSLAAVTNLSHILKMSAKSNKKMLYEHLADKFMEVISGQLGKVMRAEPLELLRCFLKNNSNYFNDYVHLFSQILAQLMTMLLNSRTSTDSSSRDITDSAWGCLLVICSQKALAISHFSIICEHLQHITAMNAAPAHSIDIDKITQCYASLIRHTRRAPTNLAELLLYVVKSQQTSNEVVYDFNVLLRAVVYYLHDRVTVDVLEILLQIVITNFDNILASPQLIAHDVCDGCILVALIVQHLHKMLSPSQLLAINRINTRLFARIQNDNAFARDSVIEKAHGINLSLYYRFGLGQFTPENNKHLMQPGNWIADLQHFESVYDNKLLCCGLISLLGWLPVTTYSEHQDSIVQLFNFLVLYLKLLQNLQALRIASNLKPDRKIKGAEEAYRSVHTELAALLSLDVNNRAAWFNCHVEKYTNREIVACIAKKDKDQDRATHKQRALRGLSSCILQEDEYALFAQLCRKLKNCPSGIWTVIMAGSSSTTLKYFPDVVYRTRYIEVDEEKELSKLRLTVRLAKRRAN